MSKDLIIEKPYAEIRRVAKSKDQGQPARIRLYRSSPYGLTLQVRVPKPKSVIYSSTMVTVDELRQMLTYAKAQWPDATRPQGQSLDIARLIKFMREEAASATDERESWFTATGDALERLANA